MSISANKLINGLSGASSDLVNVISTVSEPFKIDTSAQEAGLNALNINQNYSNFDSLLSGFASTGYANTDYTANDLGYNGDLFKRSILSNAASFGQLGNTIGSMFANGGYKYPAIGAGILFGGTLGAILAAASKPKYEREAQNLNILGEQKNQMKLMNTTNNAVNIYNDAFDNSALNIAAYGGDLFKASLDYRALKNNKIKPMKKKYIGNKFAYGGEMKFTGDFSNGLIKIENGGTHEANKNDGVQMGVDNNGIPNLVEEGEVVFNNYVFSNRLSPTKKQLEDVHLDTKYEGVPFSDIAKNIEKSTGADEAPNDTIAMNGLVTDISKLQVIQEDTRMKKEYSRFKREFSKMSPDEKEQLYQLMQQQTQQSEENISANGGHIVKKFKHRTPADHDVDYFDGESNAPDATSGKVDVVELLNAIKSYNPKDDFDFNPYYIDDSTIQGPDDKFIKTSKYLEHLPIENNGDYSNTSARYAPVLTNLIGSLAQQFTPIDYSDADIIGTAANSIPRVSFTPVGGYVQQNPIDINYLANKISNTSLGMSRQLSNSGLNAGQVMAATIPLNQRTGESISNAMIKAQAANIQDKNTAAQFALNVDKINSAGFLDADSRNASAAAERAKLLETMAFLRDRISTLSSEATSNNVTNLGTTAGNVGLDNLYANMARWYGKNVAPNTEIGRSYLDLMGR